ncbi:MAG: hypothetical protein EX271_11250 [Acidimicrobiales bacterium]|nr:hypothetical protein [Hyphomonadaceae bacterium]RZV38048.1 MAG: hypothetical protein EX271_11250 [Acidimicrobiales bacterium]
MVEILEKPKPLVVNELPQYDMSDNPTDCCPRFNPEDWDDRDLLFREKLFVRTETRSIAHIPLNMGKVFGKTFTAIEDAGAQDMDQFIVLSREVSAWKAEHFFAVTKAVPGENMVRLSGDFHTKVFEGPYREAKHWHEELVESVGGDMKKPPDVYFFYTTCPKCAKKYGKNYLVGIVRTDQI